MSDDDARSRAVRSALGRHAAQELWDALITRPTIAIPFPTMAASFGLTGRPAILCGWAVRETAGAVSVWGIFDGLDLLGSQVAPISLAANGMDRVGPDQQGILCRVGLYMVRVSGSIQGAVWVKI